MEGYGLETGVVVAGRRRVTLSGEVDFADADELVSSLIVLNGAFVELDVSGLTLIDAAGVGALIKAKTFLDGYGDGLCVIGARGLVSKVFEVLALRDWLRQPRSPGRSDERDQLATWHASTDREEVERKRSAVQQMRARLEQQFIATEAGPTPGAAVGDDR